MDGRDIAVNEARPMQPRNGGGGGGGGGRYWSAVCTNKKPALSGLFYFSDERLAGRTKSGPLDLLGTNAGESKAVPCEMKGDYWEWSSRAR